MKVRHCCAAAALSAGLISTASGTVIVNVDQGGFLPSSGESIAFTFTVAGQTAPVQDLNLRLALEAPAFIMYSIHLAAPNGATSVLPLGTVYASSNQLDGDFNPVPAQARFQDTLLDDQAPTPIAAAMAPYNGTFSPLNSLSAFNGIDPNGVWTLTITDLSFASSDSMPMWDLDVTDYGFALSTYLLYQMGDLASWGEAIGTQLIITVPAPAGLALVGLGLSVAARRRR